MIRIMIVDDEILVRIGIKSIINWEQYGYSVVCEAGSYREAVGKILSFKPQVILTDLMMEGMDGFDLIEYCIKEHPNIKLVVLSSYNDFEYVRRAMKLGASDYIFKLTVKQDELLNVLGELKNQIDSQSSEPDNILLRNISAIKSRLITAGIQQSYIKSDEFMKEFTDIGLATDFSKPYAVLYISIDGYVGEERKGFSQLQLLKISLENIIHEVISAHHNAETYNYTAGDMIVIIHPAGPDLSSSIGQDFLNVLDYTKRYLGISVSGALSDVRVGLEQLPAAVEQATKALSARFLSKLGRLYLTNDAHPYMQAEPLSRAENLTDALYAGNFALVQEYLLHMFDCLFTWEDVPVNTIRMQLLDVYGIFVRHSQSVAVAIENIKDGAGFTLYDAILSYDFLESIKKTFHEFLFQYKTLCKDNAGHGRVEILQIKSYVRDNLSTELGVEAAAELVNMSKSYFSHLFKKEVGISYVDYVNETRIKRAQELLQSTNMRVNEIADAVGITNPNYFSVLFKKLTGKTPCGFRGEVKELE